ncbi:MAG: sel1 repeat family protein [Thermoguttaceae bacterium]|nr:sel1 repeat family protein [Thermoguttaceae bacterium]
MESLLQRAAQLGAVVAMRRLGEFYEERKEWERAEYWYGQALQQNDSSSATQLGKLGALYLTKNYRATRGERAIELLRRASDAGNGEAATALGKLCARGELTPQNNEEAFALFKLGAEQGNVEAMLELGARYASGTGTDIDLREAINWLTHVAFSHDENALKKRYGESALKKLKEIADQYHIASASRAVAVWNLRLGTSVKSRYSEALRRLRLLVEQGDARAMALLGDALMLRVAETGLSSGRLKSVANLYCRAAELGDVHGMKALGDCYRLGFGKEIDEVQAATWYQAAAERGDVDAMFELARLYYRGLGVPKDVEKAREYARRARDAGNKDAQDWLDLYEFDVRPTPSSLVEEASSNDNKTSLHYRALVLQLTNRYNIS